MIRQQVPDHPTVICVPISRSHQYRFFCTFQLSAVAYTSSTCAYVHTVHDLLIGRPSYVTVVTLTSNPRCHLEDTHNDLDLSVKDAAIEHIPDVDLALLAS